MYNINVVEFGQQHKEIPYQQQPQQQQQQKSHIKNKEKNLIIKNQYEEQREYEHVQQPKIILNSTSYDNSNWLTNPIATVRTSTSNSNNNTAGITNFCLTNQREYSTCNILKPTDKSLQYHSQSQTPAIQLGVQQFYQHLKQTPAAITTIDTNNLSTFSSSTTASHMSLLTLRRRRLIQRHACLFSILIAFIFGLALGVLMPLFGLANVFDSLATTSTSSLATQSTSAISGIPILPVSNVESATIINHTSKVLVDKPPSDFPTIYELNSEQSSEQTAMETSKEAKNAATFSVAFIKEENVVLTAEQVFRNAFHLEQDKNSPNTMIVKKLDAKDGSIKEFRVEQISEGRFRKGPERRISKPSLTEQAMQSDKINFIPIEQRIMENARNAQHQGIIKSDIYWGDVVERALPKGFSGKDAKDWNEYIATQGIVDRLEPGCGRMQNRLIVFADGRRACARYRQNTDQIQGELFSFYLGQILGLSNLAPSVPAVINLESRTWSSAIADITQSQWKQQRPVVLTRWLPDLEPAGIPQPFQPLERHLNKYDVWNITLGTANAQTTFGGDTKATMSMEKQKGLLKRLETAAAAATATDAVHAMAVNRTMADHRSQMSDTSQTLNATDILNDQPVILQRLIELAQWSDLIVFDYLIANLDRVVNNLYNYQWNADIMAAPAHNLARQINTQLLVFLDNESGLLHGYRLLKKYEAYHGLLLDNLCVFRQPTIDALRELRAYGAGRKLREIFEESTSAEVRDVLPSLPDKSIKILVDRIDRVLGQVQKCQDLLADR